MKSILVAYASSEGQTKKIAARIARVAGEDGVGAELLDVTRSGAGGGLLDYDGVVLGASIHRGKHYSIPVRPEFTSYRVRPDVQASPVRPDVPASPVPPDAPAGRVPRDVPAYPVLPVVQG